MKRRFITQKMTVGKRVNGVLGIVYLIWKGLTMEDRYLH